MKFMPMPLQEAVNAKLSPDNYTAVMSALTERRIRQADTSLTRAEVQARTATYTDPTVTIDGAPSEWFVYSENDPEFFRLHLAQIQLACSVPGCVGHDTGEAVEWFGLSHVVGKARTDVGDVDLIVHEGRRRGYLYLDYNAEFELEDIPQMLAKVDEFRAALNALSAS